MSDVVIIGRMMEHWGDIGLVLSFSQNKYGEYRTELRKELHSEGYEMLAKGDYRSDKARALRLLRRLVGEQLYNFDKGLSPTW